MLLLYTHKSTPRLNFIFKHFFTRILNIEVDFTSKVEQFIAHRGPKITYGKKPLGRELFIRNHDLLFEQGINDVDIRMGTWQDVPCFFMTRQEASVPFDVFAASFYLLSRYEEYLPHVKDAFERYPAEESLAFKSGFLDKPLIDIWAYKFKAVLNKQSPNFEFPDRKYTIKPVIDIPVAYNFKLKGLMRGIGSTLNDLVRLKPKKLYYRYLVLMGIKEDPYDTFEYILSKQRQSRFKFIFFFLIGDYSTYDKNINISKAKFVSLIKHVSDYSIVGLKASYFALTDVKILKKEKEKMEAVTNSSLVASRNSFSKLNLPESYRNLVDLEIPEDYTMGYVNHVGFRAGTCTPFFFYDLDYEVQTPVKIYSYNVLDYTLLKVNSLLDKKKLINEIIQEIKAVNGYFIPVFHNYTFSEIERWEGYKELFELIIRSTDET